MRRLSPFRLLHLFLIPLLVDQAFAGPVSTPSTRPPASTPPEYSMCAINPELAMSEGVEMVSLGAAGSDRGFRHRVLLLGRSLFNRLPGPEKGPAPSLNDVRTNPSSRSSRLESADIAGVSKADMRFVGHDGRPRLKIVSGALRLVTQANSAEAKKLQLLIYSLSLVAENPLLASRPMEQQKIRQRLIEPIFARLRDYRHVRGVWPLWFVTRSAKFDRSRIGMAEAYAAGGRLALVVSARYMDELLDAFEHATPEERLGLTLHFGERLRHALLHRFTRPKNDWDWLSDEKSVTASDIENDTAMRHDPDGQLSYYQTVIDEALARFPMKAISTGGRYGKGGVFDRIRTGWMLGTDLLGEFVEYTRQGLDVRTSPASPGLPEIASPFEHGKGTPTVKTFAPSKVLPPELFSDRPSPDFSLVEYETIAAVASLQKHGLLLLAGRILQHLKPNELNSQEHLVDGMGRVLHEYGEDWAVPHETRDKILARARRGDFNVKKPQALVKTAVKDEADQRTKNAKLAVCENVFKWTVRGLKRFFGAFEGLGRDALANEDAIPAGEILSVAPAISNFTWSVGVIELTLRAMGVRSRYYTLDDSLEGTNAGVGVREENLAYKPGDLLPPYVTLADFSGASSISVDIHGTQSVNGENGVNVTNADDGYAHTVFTSVPPGKVESFRREPLDPDRPEEMFKRIREAWGGLRPDQINVIVLNRNREKQKILWLSDREYHVTLIPDGTAMPSFFAAMQGRFESNELPVVWSTSGAPEAKMSLASQKTMRLLGGVGADRLLPRVFPAQGWMGHTWSSAEDLRRFKSLIDANPDDPKVLAFNAEMKAAGKFTWTELKIYVGLHPHDWEAIASGAKIFTGEDIKGAVEIAVTFATDNKVFQEPGIRRLRDNRARVTTLRIDDVGGPVRARIQTTEGDLDDLADGKAALADLSIAFPRRLSEVLRVGVSGEILQASLAAISLASLSRLAPAIHHWHGALSIARDHLIWFFAALPPLAWGAAAISIGAVLGTLSALRQHAADRDPTQETRFRKGLAVTRARLRASA